MRPGDEFGGCVASRTRRQARARNLDCEVGIDVVLAHEGDHLAIELAFHDFYELVAHDDLVVVAELPRTRSAWPCRRACAPPVVSVPRAGWSRCFRRLWSSPSSALDRCTRASTEPLRWRSSPRGFGSLAAGPWGHLSAASSGGCWAPREGEERWSPQAALARAYSSWVGYGFRRSFCRQIAQSGVAERARAVICPSSLAGPRAAR